jgi:glutathione S-transferase
MLEEIGQPYEIVPLDLKRGDQNTTEFRALNPMGKVPVLRHGATVVSESAAICLYLAEAFPAAGLNVDIHDARRGTFLKWLFFGPSCIEPAIVDTAFPRAAPPPSSSVGYGDAQRVFDVVCGALTPGRWLLGEQFTAADVVIGSGLRWGMIFNLVPARPEITAYVERLNARPALQRATALDQSAA